MDYPCHVIILHNDKMADKDASFRQNAVTEIPAPNIHARLQIAHGDACTGANVVRRWVKHRKAGAQSPPTGHLPVARRIASTCRNELIVLHLHTKVIGIEFNGPTYNFMSLIQEICLEKTICDFSKRPDLVPTAATSINAGL